MSNQETIIAQVDEAIRSNQIIPMNELLVELSNNAELTREFRYEQQQRLRITIAHHGQRHKEDQESPDERVAHLREGGEIPVHKQP
ncbi:MULTISPECIES: DUF2526 family protein [Mangrovibacter]|uniref:Uncharacterized protein DUF2526 n=1 Tax=Mangrovibacter plantisponsor TaxID=451513 RepID=A0A317Q6D6_9ENTR|nr:MULTISPECIES: DUF2526 family protein [Mangrovibacter]KEA51011.1 hypothetical protein DT73_19575 [Mangrovibacter sp. MFB070]PWW10832.1 uncharacterized protein DUF2526 [Mangrovibacter plantisponsor]